MSKLLSQLTLMIIIFGLLAGCAPAPDVPEDPGPVMEDTAEEEIVPADTAVPPTEEMEEPEEEVVMDMSLTSPAFNDGDPIPVEYSCDGEDVSPDLDWFGIPDGTQSLAFIMDDPDAPVGTWVHWVLFNLPADMPGLQKGITGVGVDGKNSWDRTGYGGPCPPGGTHRYFFKLYALDTMLDLSEGASKADLLAAMEGHILGQAELIGTYAR